MSKTDAEISQIRKYLNGELDAKAMHQLERQAQDDPFLMDALEGYEQAPNHQQQALQQLSERLNQRVTKEKRTIIPWRTIGIAASVLAVLSIGGYWLVSNNHQRSLYTATTIKSDQQKTNPTARPVAAASQTDTSALTSIIKPAVKPGRIKSRHRSANPNELADNAIARVKPDSNTADATPLNEMVVMGYAAKAQKENRAIAVDQQKLNDSNVRAKNNYLFLNNQSLAKRIIKGTVVSKDDGLPVIGASITVPGSNTSTVTDDKGRFKISVDSSQNKLAIAYIGYNQRNVNIRNGDSLNGITLVPDNALLSEVVVTSSSALAKQNNYAVRGRNKDTALGARLLTSRNAAVSSGLPVELTNTNRLPVNIIQGKIISMDNGAPLQGVIVKFAGAARGTQTDANGRFKLSADSNKNKLNIAYKGFQPQQVRILNADSLQTIALTPYTAGSNKFVAAAPASQQQIIAAHPQIGWVAFHKYMRQHAITGDSKAGKVKLAFTVDPDGTINNIKVIKGLSTAINQKAISLLNNGSKWIGNSTNKAEKVIIQIDFHH